MFLTLFVFLYNQVHERNQVHGCSKKSSFFLFPSSKYYMYWKSVSSVSWCVCVCVCVCARCVCGCVHVRVCVCGGVLLFKRVGGCCFCLVLCRLYFLETLSKAIQLQKRSQLSIFMQITLSIAHWPFCYYSFLFIERWGTADVHRMW